jgi:hypothetical protein
LDDGFGDNNGMDDDNASDNEDITLMQLNLELNRT